MSLSTMFGFTNKVVATSELPQIAPFPMVQSVFVDTDVITIFQKILTETLERTHGLTDDQVQLMWDNCEKGNSTDGLITLLAKAMVARAELFIVYEKAVKVIRLADTTETAEIRKDYKVDGESKMGVYISFKNYARADMVKLYVALEYCTVASLYTSMNVSKSVQFKFDKLRESVNAVDASVVEDQVKLMATGVNEGRAVMLDSKDIIEMLKPDLTATDAAIKFIAQKLSFYLGLPASWITGEQTSGMGTTGEQDTKAVERGLKAYFFSIIKPVVETIFGITVTYRSQDFRQITSSIEVLKNFDLTSDDLISHENKTKIVNRLFELPDDAEGDEPELAPAVVPGAVVPGAPKVPAVPLA